MYLYEFFSVKLKTNRNNMVETKELVADRDWLIKACALMKKLYDEQSKLVKQNKQNLINNEPIFIYHVVMKKRFVISYIQPFHGCVDEMVFEELAPFMNPNQFKNGVLVVSSKSKLDFLSCYLVFRCLAFCFSSCFIIFVLATTDGSD